MALTKSRIRVNAVGGDIGSNFTLGSPISSFSSFSDGSTKYCVIAATGEWQIGNGVVTGNTLTRGTVEENHLGTTAQINFNGKAIEIAQTLSVAFFNSIEYRIVAIETEGAVANPAASAVVFDPTGTNLGATTSQGAIVELDSDLTTHTHPYVDGAVMSLGPTPPLIPVNGQEWLNTDNMRTYSWYEGTSNNQWIEI